jgi:CubicO group peptidase (beta-lactamase class C family)
MTPDNWRKHPFAPWAFANVAQFLPTAPVRKAGPQRPLAAGEPLLLARGAAGEDATCLTAFLRLTHADGFVVLHRGAIVYEHYAAATSAASRHLCFSVTKSVVGLLAELLLAEGAVSPDLRAGEVVSELAGTAFAAARLRDLLDMRDGVAFDEDYANPGAAIHLYSRHYWGAGAGGVLAGLRALTAQTLPHAPFLYRTPATDVVGLMIERATATSLPDLVSERIWRRIGAANHARWVQDTGGRAIAATGLACTLRDLARLGAALCDAVRGNGPAGWEGAARALLDGGARDAFATSANETRPGWSYRGGWWVDHGTAAINAIGVFGQRLHVAPADDVVIARFGSHPVASNQHTDLAHARLFATIRGALRER